jgi:Transcriptional regulator
MSGKRISSDERRALILEAARGVFSRFGYEGARTQEIARAAGVSEALIYRHFSSKEVLHTAVLRETIREQNASYHLIGLQDLTPRGLILNLRGYFRIVTGDGPERVREGFRLLLSSVAGDNQFARQIYRRAQRMQVEMIRKVLGDAKDAGDIVGDVLDVANTSMFIEHIGTMMNSLYEASAHNSPYHGDRDKIVDDATRFVARGLGFREETINRLLAG